MQARPRIERQHVAQRKPRPQPVVLVVGVRHHGVQAVVAALELHQDEEASVVRGLCPGRVRQKKRGERGAEEVPAIHLSWYTGSATSARTMSRPSPAGWPTGAAARSTSGSIA